MLSLCTLASGSKGNSTLVRSEQGTVLIDCGISRKLELERLAAVGAEPQSIDAILVTHVHSDHIAGIARFARCADIPVYAPAPVAAGLRTLSDSGVNVISVEYGDFFVKDITVSAFAVPHDVPCFGYSLYAAGNKATVVTDLGVLAPDRLKEIADSDIVVLESNHDEAMLRANPRYSSALKQRILSARGHLSNAASSEASAFLAAHGVRQILLAHLSRENNDPVLALKVHTERLARDGIAVGRDVGLDVATQDAASKLYETA